MQNFRTVVTPGKSTFRISHLDRMVSIGSCFSENIGNKFLDFKFKIAINPFGQQYNPFSISRSINRLIGGRPYTEKELVYHDELYHSFDHHGSFSGKSAAETLRSINDDLSKTAVELKNASVLFLTFGTSHIYRLKDSGEIVSNCHKLSGTYFDRGLMRPAEIVKVLDEALASLLTFNDKIQIVVTISPVRYFAFGHYENSVSKGHLFTAIHELQQRYPGIFYFPAYELVLDDLRDYRFYSEDMLHPNYQATHYVWENLCETFIDKKTQAVMKEIAVILLAAKHKPRNPDSELHKKFIRKNLEMIGKLRTDFQIDFSREEAILEKWLKTSEV